MATWEICLLMLLPLLMFFEACLCGSLVDWLKRRVATRGCNESGEEASA